MACGQKVVSTLEKFSSPERTLLKEIDNHHHHQLNIPFLPRSYLLLPNSIRYTIELWTGWASNGPGRHSQKFERAGPNTRPGRAGNVRPVQ